MPRFLLFFILSLTLPSILNWVFSISCRRVRGGNGCKVGDDNGSLMLMWEDGFCRGSVDGEDPVRKAFSKMSIQLYNYGEGLMGKVASDKCHKWVFKEPTECEPNISNYWQSSFDALPPEWTDQFESGIQVRAESLLVLFGFCCYYRSQQIFVLHFSTQFYLLLLHDQTIAVIQAGHGLLQLGSCKIIPEDLHFVLRMRHTFESLGYQSGFYLSQLFSSTRNTSSSTSVPSKPSTIPVRPPPLFNWGQRPLTSATSMLSSPNFQQHAARLGFPKDEANMFLIPHASSESARVEDMMGEHENDIKWPNGLSFFNALTGRTDDAKLLFNPDTLGNKPGDQTQHHPLTQNPNSDASNMQNASASNPNEFLSLDNNQDDARKMDKFKRSFTLPARVASSSSSTSMDHHQTQGVQFRNSEGAMYPDVMETFLE
ncbi:hypothetical protein VIGAN_07134800 [Vigna angularis var. angularis]|uniref:Transcription factor MYC/MYB N-terminal domain-containing protein n=1 Tax=Vigna angularis var. angularis TaxID=157739 RepID=A0A0S3SIG4_PHAAN|nr:hypothetical protein VIGAN_07134800 [Vigna angularis var. angularis]